MNYQELKDFLTKELIYLNEKPIKMSSKLINQFEQELNIKFPIDYRLFLGDFSYISLYGVEIYGHLETFDFNPLIKNTLECREGGLPLHLIVLRNLGEFYVCLDSKTGKIVLWSWLDKEEDITLTNKSFSEYFLEKLQEAKRNYLLFG